MRTTLLGLILVGFLAAPAAARPDDIATQEYVAGIQAAQAGNHEAALVLFDLAVRRAPELPEVHYARGTSLLSLNRGDEAQAAFAEADRLQPGFTAAAQANRVPSLGAGPSLDEMMVEFDQNGVYHIQGCARSKRGTAIDIKTASERYRACPVCCPLCKLKQVVLDAGRRATVVAAPGPASVGKATIETTARPTGAAATGSAATATSDTGRSDGVGTTSSGSTGSTGDVHVKGYYRKDGKYVQPHTRSRPRKH